MFRNVRHMKGIEALRSTSNTICLCSERRIFNTKGNDYLLFGRSFINSPELINEIRQYTPTSSPNAEIADHEQGRLSGDYSPRESRIESPANNLRLWPTRLKCVPTHLCVEPPHLPAERLLFILANLAERAVSEWRYLAVLEVL